MRLIYKGWKTLLWTLMLGILGACTSDTPPTPDDSFVFRAPDNFPEPTYTFQNNPVSEAGFKLGRKLFFDQRLSRDNTIACSSCHSQSVAFADPQHRLSVGIDNRIGKRNAPPIANLAFKKHFFWDGGVTHVDFIAVNAIENEVEMDTDIFPVLEKLRADETYRMMFSEAFGGDTINSGRMLHALSQFMNMMVSANSAYDQAIRGEGPALEAQAQAGLRLFEQKCATCHSGALFTSEQFKNNGLDTEFRDAGRFIITENEVDRGKFRIPSLRNVALTGPYMHDGRFASLEEVLDHYASGVKDSPSLAPELKPATGRLGIAMTDTEKQAIISFLHTLTDHEFTINPLFFNR